VLRVHYQPHCKNVQNTLLRKLENPSKWQYKAYNSLQNTDAVHYQSHCKNVQNTLLRKLENPSKWQYKAHSSLHNTDAGAKLNVSLTV